MPLKVTHYEKGYIYTASELTMLAKKVGRLSRYCSRMLDESSLMKVETVSRDTKKQRDSVKVMITITLPHKTIRAESRKSKALAAIDRCCEKLESQLKKYKEKHSTEKKRISKTARRRKSS
jgi:ribosomal subunit interface protein